MQMTKKKWMVVATVLIGAVLMAACTKEGDTIYEPDPADQGSSAPLVTVVYDPNALGDRGYNDLIYRGGKPPRQTVRTSESVGKVETGLSERRTKRI